MEVTIRTFAAGCRDDSQDTGTSESAGCDIVSREIGPVLFTASRQRKIPSCNGASGTFAYRSQPIISNQPVQLVFGLSSIPRRFRSAIHYIPYRYRCRSMIGHTDGSVLNDDSECPGRGSRTPAVRARSSLSQPVAVGCAAGRPG